MTGRENPGPVTGQIPRPVTGQIPGPVTGQIPKNLVPRTRKDYPQTWRWVFFLSSCPQTLGWKTHRVDLEQIDVCLSGNFPGSPGNSPPMRTQSEKGSQTGTA